MFRNNQLSIAAGCHISQATFGTHVRIGSGVTLIRSAVADFSYIGHHSVVCSSKIGKYCSIAAEVQLGTGSHPSVGFVSTHPAFYLARPDIGWTISDKDYFQEFRQTCIGHDVWLGTRVIIRDGVVIGNGAIVGAGAVVVKDLEPYGIYAGIPARLIRYRFSHREIAQLQSIMWWDKGESWVREHFREFQNLGEFLKMHGPGDSGDC